MEGKVAVVGAGKTGRYVVEEIPKAHLVGPFTSKHPPTLGELQESDVIICFVPGDCISEVWPLFLESERPVIWGSTGGEWPEGIDALLRERGVAWLWGANFSLAMSLVRRMLHFLGKASRLLPHAQLSMEEEHHCHKKDCPSGTALMWKRWLGVDCSIESKREGDIVGTHRVFLESALEKVVVQHESKDRRLFAQGALWAAEELKKGYLGPGFHLFEELVDHVLGG